MSQTPNQEEEIDLKTIFESIWNFFRAIGNFFLRIIIGLRRLTIKRIFLIIVILVIGGIISLGYHLKRTPYYQTSLLLSCSYLNNKLVENSIEKLNKLVDGNNPQGLANELQISTELAKNIIFFEAQPFVPESELVEIEVLEEKLKNLRIPTEEINLIVNQIRIQNQNAYQITVSVLDPEVLGDLENPLVKYFRENPYIKRRVDINRTNLEEQKSKLEDELKQIDSLKRVLYRYIEKSGGGREGVSNIILGDPSVSDPISVFREDFSLYQIYQRVQRQLYLQEDFELIDGFTAFRKPASAGLFTVIGNGLLISLGLAYVLLFFIEFNKYLTKVEKERSEEL